ncbi:hypothetical protein [Falsibacillus pallidus]|uniref:Uncharacterized protein n=1 Tax=Falsibacillus pallidus TaxID=493781 RepID=A0A370GP69_9BACI|nr:hypothetical protein [Falsibacillus pallidus]RDI45542.1 hypothetical protein DFR59_102170 [Falsibacillus pallidus]
MKDVTLVEQLTIIIAFALGGLLIAIFPIIKKESKFFAWFSLAVGIIVWLCLMQFTLGNSAIRASFLGI